MEVKKLSEEEIIEIRSKAEALYREGKFYCSEAVVKAVLDGLGVEYPERAVAMASGFPVGIGGAECLCGALAGGVMSLGYIYGRTEGGSPEVADTMALSRELHGKFIERNRITCCRALTRGMVKGTPEHMSQCIRFTGEMAEDTLRIIMKRSIK